MVAYLDPPIKRLLGLLRYPVLLVLLSGLGLTFSRSSIVSLSVGFFLFALVRHGSWLRHISTRALFSGIATTVGILAFGLILFWLFPVAFQFFDVRLLSFLTNEGDVVTALNTPTSSEGARVFIATNVIEFVVRNPVTGSGYLGVWTIPDLPAGSAHGQYMDVFFRTGPVGFVCYLSIFYAVLRYLRRYQEALFWGVLSAGVYGLFHEMFRGVARRVHLRSPCGHDAQVSSRQESCAASCRANGRASDGYAFGPPTRTPDGSLHGNRNSQSQAAAHDLMGHPRAQPRWLKSR